MSAKVISRVMALARKAKELDAKGHVLRAVENYGRAADAARTLDPGDDNFARLDMLHCQAEALLRHSANLFNMKVDLSTSAASFAESVGLHMTVAVALERRRVAGTLLEGKCTAAEEAFWTAWLQHFAVGCEEADFRKLFGYETFISSATSTMAVLSNASFYAKACSATLFELLAQHVVHAMDLLPLPRNPRLNNIQMYSESCFAMQLSEMVPLLGSSGLNPRLVQLLTDAWQRLQQSGVLVERGLFEEDIVSVIAAKKTQREEAAASALSASSLRSCALASCGGREAHPQHFKKCASCLTVVYCCREHQVADWPAHKTACKAARKTAAAGKGAAEPTQRR